MEILGYLLLVAAVGFAIKLSVGDDIDDDHWPGPTATIDDIPAPPINFIPSAGGKILK